MKQSTVIGGILVLLVIVLGLWYYMTPGAGTSSDEMATSTATSTSDSTSDTSGTTPKVTAVTFRSIFTQSGNTQCDYSQTDTSSNGTSVIYISDGKMHGEFRADIDGQKTATLMTYNGGYLYSWKEGQLQAPRQASRLSLTYLQ